ncbi:GlxA family transcriptional regulator [Mesorhizobium sp. M0204]|uniref:GlxA family transcriptional regulator n=1 Tax=Mesorhizobium sp. M0204 TaxID=2956913 RepID=UPI00333C2CAB
MNAPSKRTSFKAESHFREAQTLRGDLTPAEFLVLLLPGFSQLCLSSFIDPLRLANSLSGHELFSWRLASLDGQSVASASGISVGVSGGLMDQAQPHQADPRGGILLCAGEGVEGHSSRGLRAFLRDCARSRVPVYALGTATWLLADAGVLGNSRCTIHWGKMAALSETYYDLNIDDVLFVRGGQFVTCAGELAAFDLAIDVIEDSCSDDLVRDICQHLTADRWRDGESSQSVPPGLRYAGAAKKLLRILQLMEKNVEEPLSLRDISRRAELSRRQIERLFARHLSTTPWQHYLSLRLLKARQLIEMTAMPITDVAIACGFVSASHFSKCFREHFKMSPSRVRAGSQTAA